ncbi:MAG: TetR/AcrR family transcriptional regulator [Sphingomonadales bacterium]
MVNYHDHLQLQISKLPKRGPARTKEHVKAAAARMLETDSYYNIRIDALCNEAGVAKGTFYLHFQDKEELTVHILEEYTTIQVQLIPDLHHVADSYEALKTINTWFARSFVENIGLHRNLMQLSEKIPAITEIWTTFLSTVSDMYIRDIFQRVGSVISYDQALLAIYSLGGMLDQALYAIHAVHRNPSFERLAASLENLVETVTVLQHRAIYMQDPRLEQLDFARDLLKLKAVR